VLAGRRRDADDIRLLADHLGLGDAGEVRATCISVFPDEPIPRTLGAAA
jgi:phosphoglycolate phosphatase-like HAD superfamily hydrolase